MPKIIDNPRQTIIEHAKRLLLEGGYDSLNVRKIAQSSGIAVGTIYNYFATKQDIITQIMVTHWEEYFDTIAEIDQQDLDLFAKMAEIFRQLENFINTFKGIWIKMNSQNVWSLHGKKDKHYDYLQRLSVILEGILKREVSRSVELQLPLESSEITGFILQNFLVMCQMKQFSYSSFEKVLRKLLTQ